MIKRAWARLRPSADGGSSPRRRRRSGGRAVVLAATATLAAGGLGGIALSNTAAAGDSEAGPVILDGTDAGLHGSITLDGSGIPKADELNSTWIYELKAWETLLGGLPVGYSHNDKVAVVGAADSTATRNDCGAAAHYVAERLASGPMTVDYFEGATAIQDLMDGILAGTDRYAMVNIVEQGWCGNGLDSTEASVVNASGPAIAAHVNRGGALFTQAQSYGWLNDLFPTLVASNDWTECESFGSTPELTAAGYSQFPGLDNTDIAAPWHTCFELAAGETEWPLTQLALEKNTGLTVILGGGSVELPSNVSLDVTPEQPRPGEEVCATATVTDNGTPVEAASVDFAIDGASDDPGSTVSTDVNGVAGYCYSSAGSGVETVTATVSSGPGTGSSTSGYTWSRIALAASPSDVLQRDEQVCLTATVADFDTATSTLVPVEGETVTFAVSGANSPTGATPTTDVNGEAQYCYTGTVSGTDTATAAIGSGETADSRSMVITYAGPQVSVPDIAQSAGSSGKVVPVSITEFDTATTLYATVSVPADNGTLSVDTSGLTLTLAGGSDSFTGRTSITFTGSNADVAAALGTRVTWAAPADGLVSTFTANVRDAELEADATLIAEMTAETTAATMPTIDTVPADATVVEGSSVTFTTAASGLPAPNIRWQSSTDGTTWTDIVDATGAEYTFSPTMDDDGTQYRALATNSQGLVVSGPATLTVTSAPIVQTISFDAPAASATVGDAPIELAATASSGLPVEFEAGPSSVCTLSGATLSFVGAGTCKVTATQAGDGTYAAADPIVRSITVVAAFVPEEDPGDPGDTKLDLTLELTAGLKVGGSTVEVKGSGLKPSSDYRIEMHSDPVVLGTGTTDGSGAFARTVTLPADVTAGEHAVIAIGEDPDGGEVTASKGLFVDWSGLAGPERSKNGFVAVSPVRIVDTRSATPLAAGEVFRFDVAGRGDVPAGTSAVALNVTSTRSVADGYLTVFPCGVEQPATSTLNFWAGQDIANMATVSLQPEGDVCVVSTVATDLVVDMNGLYGAASTDRYDGHAPVRVLDTRSDVAVAAGGSVPVRVTGDGLAPEGAVAVAVNVTVTEPGAAGYVAVFPCGEDAPEASNVNFGAGETVANQAIVKVGDGGQVCVHTSARTHVVVDLSGSFHAGADGDLMALVPGRHMDTRVPAEGIAVKAAAGEVVTVDLVGDGLLPADTAAVALNVTVTEAESAGYVTVFPCGGDVPYVSNVNFVAGQSVGNHVTVDVGDGGTVCLVSSVSSHLVLDVGGAYLTNA